MSNVYLDTFRALYRHGVSCVIVGGTAIVLHGRHRFTADIDLVIDFAPDNIKAIARVAQDLGYVPSAPVSIEDLADADKRREWREKKNALVFTLRDPHHMYRTIDIFLEHQLPFDELLQSAVTRCGGDFELKIASMKHLLAMKRMVQPPREQDLGDIQFLAKFVR